MSMISELIKNLRWYGSYADSAEKDLMYKAADTIEALSAKLAEANMERPDRCYGDGWIACEDRLPDGYCHCLVTRRNDYEDGFDTDVREDVWIELEGVWGWQSKYEGLIDNVIAWQPLPEPYRPQPQGS